MSHPTISVIFPVHNEAQILTRQIGSFLSQLKTFNLSIKELILVENGSQDSSWQIILNLRRRYRLIKPIRLPHASYGQSLKASLIQASGNFIFIFNVDFFDISFINQSLNLLKTADIVIGSKTLAASQDLRSHFRRLTTYLFNSLLRLILNYPGTDTHGIKALKNTPLLKYCLHRNRTQNELFDTELVIRAHRWGAILTELPVTVREIRPTRYPWLRRIWLTAIDLITAIWSKYLIPNFAQKVVVADDYGRSAEVNQAIVSAVQAEVVQIISILPNKISQPQIVQLKRKVKKTHFSAHLNLVEGKPISPSTKVDTLINSTVIFGPCPYFYCDYS